MNERLLLTELSALLSDLMRLYSVQAVVFGNV